MPTRGVSVIAVTTSIEWQQIQGIDCGCRLTTPHRSMLNLESKFAGISDEFWDRVQWLLPTPPVRRNHKGGCPPTPDRVVLSGILYRLRTGCQWEAIPKELGSGSTCYRRFKKWQQAHVFELMHREMLRYYDDKVGLEWDWTSLDSANIKAPKGGTSQAPTPPIAPSSAPNGMS